MPFDLDDRRTRVPAPRAGLRPLAAFLAALMLPVGIGLASGALAAASRDASSDSADAEGTGSTEGQGQQNTQATEQGGSAAAGGAAADPTPAAPDAAQLQAAGFADHGVPTQVAQTRGIVSTTGPAGEDVVLTWLQDWRGGFSLMMVNATTGATEQFQTPFDPNGDEPAAVYLSSKNRFYTLFNNYFIEFDVATKRFSFVGQTQGKTAMSLTEDGGGRIWAATYPNNQLVAYTPDSGAVEEYGAVANESWAQYPRSIAVDQQGWVYVGTGMAASQIYAFNPTSRTAQPLIPTPQRISGQAVVTQADTNVVYGSNGNGRYILSNGKATGLGPNDKTAASSLKTGAQNLTDRNFPSGRRLVDIDMHTRRLVTRSPDGQNQEVAFDYTTEGASLTFVCTMEDGTVCGGTRFPMHTFMLPAAQGSTFDSKRVNRQPNVMVPVGKRLYVGAYPDGELLQEKNDGQNEYNDVLQANPSINRPHALLAQRSGALMVMAGTPEYGMTGGGMVFWNRINGDRAAIDHTQLIPDHSVQALIELPNGTLLGGTTVKPGTGGVTKGGDSGELFLMDPNTHQVSWHGTPVKGARTITDLVVAPDGLVYGIADSVDLFAFNPETHQVVSAKNFSRQLGTAAVFAQGTRAFVKTAGAGGAETVYVLLHDGIARLDTASHTLARVVQSPMRITVGGAAANGRIYFGSNNHLYSWQIQ